MRWCSILLVALGVLACDREGLTRIEYGPPVAVEARLAENVIKAGERTTVDCVLQAAEGFQVLNPESYRTYVEGAGWLEIDGHEVGGRIPDEYEILCGFEGMSESIEQLPDTLVIEPADARRLDLVVEPDRDFYRIGSSVTVQALVLDAYDNPIEELSSLVRWRIPGAGLTETGSDHGERSFRFEADGEYPISAYIADPYHLDSEERVLVCDSVAPDLVLLSPERGEYLDDPVIAVTGTVSDEISGLATLTVNGQEVSVSSNDTFAIDLVPAHGLNHVSVVALDAAGNRAEAATSVYHGSAWRPLGDGSFDEAMEDGLGVHLGQEVIDSGSRLCGEDAAGRYVCEAYEDMATMAEVLLNNMDLTAMAEGPVYEYGPILLTEEYLGSTSIDIPSTFMSDPYRIHGSFVLRGDYTVSANITSVEMGRAEMGDLDRGILGLQAVEGGLDLLAYVRPDGDLDSGLAIVLQIRLDVDLRVFFTVDDSYHPDNGVWNLETGEDVTDGACGDLGTLELIDMVLGWLGYSSNLHGYICLEDPVATSYPHAYTGTTASFERARILARLLIDLGRDGGVDVTLQAQPGEPLIDFLGDAVTVESDEEIIVDLTSVDVIDGFFTVDLGEFSIGSPVTLLDPILSTLLTELQVALAFVLEDLIVCEGSVSGCPLDVEGLIEDIFNSLAERDLPIGWPAVMPGGFGMSATLSQYFSAVSFDGFGGRMGFDTALVTERRLDESIPEPRGTLLRGGCAGNGALAAVPKERRMAAGFDVDLVNQALLMGWYNGGLGGALEPAETGESIESMSAVLHPLLPPVITACTGSADELELQLGAARLDLTMRVGGVLVEATVYSDLALPIELGDLDGRLDLVVSGEPRLNELELLSTGVRLGSYADEVKRIIGGELMPDLLTRFGETVLAGIPVPTINLTGASLPGVDMDIELDFPVTEASHEEAVIVVVSE